MKIHFFGCSFTEGGGLDDFDYYNFLTGKNYNINDNIRDQFEELRMFKEENRYSTIVGKILGLEVENYAFGCNSNEGILKKVFEVLNDVETNKNDIFIIQPSFFSRKFYWYEPFQEFLSVNALNPSDWPYRNMEEWMPLHQLHNLNVKYCHNEEYELSKLLVNMELYNAYFREKNIKLFWTPWLDLSMERLHIKLNENNKLLTKKYGNIIFYGESKQLSMGRYIGDNWLQIRDHFKESMDSHKSIKGHQMVGKQIADYLKDKI